MNKQNKQNQQIVERFNTNSIIPMPLLNYRPTTYVYVIIALLLIVIGVGTYTFINYKQNQRAKLNQLEISLRPITKIEDSIDSLARKEVITLEAIQKEKERWEKIEQELLNKDKEEITLDEAIKLLNKL